MGIPVKRNWKDLEAEFNYTMTCREEVDNREHLPFLREVAKGNVLEIGVDIGNSTTALLLGVQEKGGTLTSIDIRKECSVVYEGHPQWKFIAANSNEMTRGFALDVCYIDGDHSYEATLNDLLSAVTCMNKGGIILVHDVEAVTPPNVFPGVRKAFDEVGSNGNGVTKYILHGSNGLGVIKFG